MVSNNPNHSQPHIRLPVFLAENVVHVKIFFLHISFSYLLNNDSDVLHPMNNLVLNSFILILMQF